MASGRTVTLANGTVLTGSAAQNYGKPVPSPITQPVPQYGSDVKDTSGNIVGQAKFNPNTGSSLVNPNQSTTTLSNANKIDQIGKNLNKFAGLAQKGSTTNATGNPIDPTGAFIPEPSVTADTSDEDNQINSYLDSFKQSTDANTAFQIGNIQQQFAQRKQQQLDANTRNEKATQNALLMGGATGQDSNAQYAPVSSQGIVSAQENYGIQQLASLDSQENNLIAQAKQAQQDQNYKLMEQKLQLAQDKRKEKLNAASKLNDQIAEQNQKAQEEFIQNAKQDAIAEVYSQGITDVAEATRALKDQGIQVSPKEVSDNIALYSGTGGTGMVGEYNFYRANAKAIGQVPVDFNTYQNIDANRKKSIARAGMSSGDGSVLGASTSTDEDGNLIETGNYDALTIGRYNKAANAATAVLKTNPTFKNIIGSSAYLDRIEAAINNPGSVGDQELLDAFTQLNTGGNRVTEAQVHLITSNQSLSDTVNKLGNKLKTGGALSQAQRNEIVKLSQEVYKNYQKSYKPLYDDATKRLQAQGIPPQFWNIPSPETLSRAVSDTSKGTGIDLIQQGEQAKSDINDVYLTAPDNVISIIDKAHDQGLDDITILTELKKRGLIK